MRPYLRKGGTKLQITVIKYRSRLVVTYPNGAEDVFKSKRASKFNNTQTIAVRGMVILRLAKLSALPCEPLNSREWSKLLSPPDSNPYPFGFHEPASLFRIWERMGFVITDRTVHPDLYQLHPDLTFIFKRDDDKDLVVQPVTESSVNRKTAIIQHRLRDLMSCYNLTKDELIELIKNL